MAVSPAEVLKRIGFRNRESPEIMQAVWRLLEDFSSYVGLHEACTGMARDESLVTAAELQKSRRKGLRIVPSEIFVGKDELTVDQRVRIGIDGSTGSKSLVMKNRPSRGGGGTVSKTKKRGCCNSCCCYAPAGGNCIQNACLK